jgi:hypothetical protein
MISPLQEIFIFRRQLLVELSFDTVLFWLTPPPLFRNRFPMARLQDDVRSGWIRKCIETRLL